MAGVQAARPPRPRLDRGPVPRVERSGDGFIVLVYGRTSRERLRLPAKYVTVVREEPGVVVEIITSAGRLFTADRRGLRVTVAGQRA